MPTYYFVNAGNINRIWGFSGSWATSSGGNPGTLSFPTASDNVFFDANSGTGTCSIDIARACSSSNFTGYTGTLRMTTASLTIGTTTAGNRVALILGSGMTVDATGTGELIITSPNNTTASLTSNGKIWNGTLQLKQANAVYQLEDNWTTLNLNIGATTNNSMILTSSAANITMSVLGDLTCSIGGTGRIGPSGNPVPLILLRGSGTWTGSAYITNAMMISASGAITVAGLVRKYSPGNFTYVTASSLTTTNSTVQLGHQSANETWSTDFNNSTWNNVSMSGQHTNNMLSDITVNGTLTIGVTSPGYILNGPGKVNARGNVTLATRTSGSSEIIMTGSGTLSQTGTLGSRWNELALTINTTGSITASGTIVHVGGRLRYVTGSVLTALSTLRISEVAGATTPLDTRTLSWDAIEIRQQNAYTIVLESPLTASTLSIIPTSGIGQANYFSGSSGFRTNTLTCTIAGTVLQFADNVEYIVTGSLNCVGTPASPILFRNTSLTTTSRSFFTHQSGGSQTMVYISGSYIDSSRGQTIWSTGVDTGALTQTINWNPGSGPAESAFVFVY